MPLASVTYYDGPWSGGTSQACEAQLGSVTTIAASPYYASSVGYAGRLYVVATNGATNSVIYNVQGSYNGSSWFNLATRADSSASYVTTAVTTTAGAQACLFLNPLDVPVYVRVNVTTANANGTSFAVWMER